MTPIKPAKIIFYFYSIREAGGAERMLCNLVHALHSRGCNVSIVSWDQPNANSFYPLNTGIKWHRLGYKSGIKNKLSRILSLSKLLKKENIKTLVGFVMSNDKTVYSAAILSNTKIIVAERNSPSMYYHRYGVLDRLLCFSLLHLSDKIIVQFPQFKDQYPNSLRKKIVTISNPVELPKKIITPKKSKNGTFTLLAVSRLDETQKKISTLIYAFSSIAAAMPNWNLEIVGSGKDKKLLESLITSNKLTNRIRILEPSQEIFKKYHSSHLFVIPSLWEGFPNALAEALAHGLPAVGFEKADGVNILIEKGYNGWLAKGSNDPVNLAKELIAAMRDHKERKLRSLASKKSVERYGGNYQIEQWMDITQS